jgi:hypothetical protein
VDHVSGSGKLASSRSRPGPATYIHSFIHVTPVAKNQEKIRQPFPDTAVVAHSRVKQSNNLRCGMKTGRKPYSGSVLCLTITWCPADDWLSSTGPAGQAGSNNEQTHTQMYTHKLRVRHTPTHISATNTAFRNNIIIRRHPVQAQVVTP